jgi:hypothetical protein
MCDGEEGINRDGQDKQDKSNAEKALLRCLIQNLKSKIQNGFYPVHPVHPC